MLLTIVIVLVVCGIAWAVIERSPLAQPFKWGLLAIVGLIAVVYLLSLLPGHHTLVV